MIAVSNPNNKPPSAAAKLISAINLLLTPACTGRFRTTASAGSFLSTVEVVFILLGFGPDLYPRGVALLERADGYFAVFAWLVEVVTVNEERSAVGVFVSSIADAGFT